MSTWIRGTKAPVADELDVADLVVTEGVLLRQMLEEPELRGVTALIFDESTDRAYRQALTSIDEGLKTGTLLRSEVLDRWRIA